MPIDGNILLGVAFDPASYSNAQRQLQNLSRRATVDLKVNHAPLGRINADLHEFDKSLQAANARVLAFGASTGAVYGIGRAFTEITKSFINIEAKFKSIQVVLNSTTAVFENFKGSIFAIGRDTGKSFEEVTDAAQELVRQGLKISETLQRTSDAMILSRQSGLSASEAVTSLTAALNTFNQEALTSTQVINKLANVDANFAVSQKDLIDAISRSGSAAQDAGVQFDKLLSLTTSLQQTTARGGAVIGNALKSIFTRVQRSTTLEALEEFNIQTKDLQGNILSADVLLQNLAKTYKTLSTAEKSALSEQVAGIQQINQLKALLADLARANSVYSQALKTSSSSVNEAIERNKSLNETLKATLNATKLNALEFSETVGKLALAPALKLPLGSANALFDIFKDKDQDSKGTGQKIGEGILRGIGSVLSGPGLVLATAIITNTLKELGRFTFSVISDYSSLNNKTKEQINVQHAISQILSDGNNKYAARLAAAKSIKEEEAAIRLIMLEQNNIVARKSAMYAQPVRNIVSSGGDVTREGAFKLPKKAAGGYLPVYEEYQDIQRGVGGASRAAKPKVIPNFNFGGGKRGTIVANTDEYIVPNYAGGDGSAIFNPNMVARHGLPLGARKINASGGFVPNYAVDIPLTPIPRNAKHLNFPKKITVSDEDERLVSQYKWSVYQEPNGPFRIKTGKNNEISLSSILFGNVSERKLASFKDGNPLNFQRDNVILDNASHGITRGMSTRSKLGRGVSRYGTGYKAQVYYDGNKLFSSIADNPESARDIYDEFNKNQKYLGSDKLNLNSSYYKKPLPVGLSFMNYKQWVKIPGNEKLSTATYREQRREYIRNKLQDRHPEYFSGGFVPNFNTLLGSGGYGSFYDLNRKFKGVDIGKKVFNANIGGRSGDPYLKQAYTEKHITDEFIAAKVLENLSKSGQLPPNVSAPQIFGTLEGALKNKSIYKQVVHGKTGGDLSDRFKTEVYKKKNPSAEDWARSDGGEFFAGSIASFLQNHLTSNLGIEPTDLHAGNYMMTPALSRQLGMFISTNPKKAKAIGEGSQEDFEKFFLPILKQKDNGLSIFDSGELRSSKDLRKMAGLAGGFIPNFSTYITPTKKLLKALRKDGVDFNRWGESPNYRPGYSSVNGTLNPEIQIPKKNRGFFTGSPVLDLIHEAGHHFSQDDPRHQSLLKILFNPKIAAQNERLGNEYGLAAMQQLNYPEKDIKKFAVHAQKFYETYARDESGRKRRGVPLDVFAPAAGGYIPNFADKLLRSEAIAKIMAAKNKMFGAEFTKRTTGESRTGTFRLARNVKAGKVGGSLPYSAKGHKLVPVFDMGLAKEQGAQGSYRMLPYEGLNKLHIDGKEYDVVDNMAGGFIPNYADNLLTDHESFTRLEKLLGRVMGFNLVPTSLEENGKKFKITDEELRKLKLKGRTFDTTGNFSKSIENGEAFDPLFSPKSVGNLLTRPREFNIDKYKETKIATGLQESHKITDLFKAAGITPSADPILLKQQIQDLASSKFGKNNFIYKGVNGLQGNQVYPPEMFDLNAAAHYKDLFIQRGIEPTRGNLADQFYNEFRVDVVGGRKGVFGSIPLLKQKVEYLGGKTMSGKPTFRSKFNQHIEKYNLDFLKNPIQAFRALKNAYSSINSIDPAKRAGVSFGVDAFPDGTIELNPSNKTGISGSAGSNLFSSLLTARGLRKASKENVNYFTGRGKGILGLSGSDQAKKFKELTKELLEFQKYDQYGYLKVAKNLHNLGFGLTIGKGRQKEQFGGDRAKNLFKKLGLAGGFIPNYADPLSEAIQREQAAGLPLNQIKVENHPSLISNLNPGGLAVTNKRDEPGGITQGISRAIKEGRDPKKYGAAKGLIPNFAPSFFPDPTFTEGTVKALGMTGNVSPASRAKIKDFTTGIKLSEQDLLLPTQDLRKKIQASITQAFKIDPRFVSEAFEKGAENIADSFVKAQKTAMIKAYQKNLKAGQDDYVRQELVSGVTDKINRQSSLLFGGFKNKKIISSVENSPEYKALSDKAKLATSSELNNLAFDNSEKRKAKLQSRALTASFGIPVATGALLSQLNPNDPKSKKFAGIAEGVSTGLSVAAIGGFSPLAVGAGLVLGGGSIASSLAKSRRKSPEQLSEELTNARGKFESSRNAVLGTFQGQDALKEAIEKGSSLGEVRLLSRQITDSISGIEESSLRNKVIAAKTDEERANVIDEINKVGIQKVSRAGLSSKLEESVGPNRGLLSDITGRSKSIVLKPQDIKDIGSLVAGASPLKFDKDGKVDQKQLAGLQELSKKGDFNIDEVEKVLGNLQISRESRNQLGQFTVGSQKAIAKDVVERQLSIAALDKNNEGLVKFNNLLLRVGKTLDTLSSNLDFKFKIQNINTAGIRDRAISGASQSLGGISEFLSPELRNKQESLIAGTQIENQRISTINEAATGWVKSLRDLENTVPAALKGNDDGQGGEGYSAKGEPLKREFREILTKVIANGQSDPVSAGLEGLKELKNLNAKFDKSNDPNGKLKDAVLKFTQGLTQNISVADAVAANSKASLDQTTKINELIISLQKSQNFLGGGTFESSKDLDFSKIQSSSRLTRQFKDDLTNPSKDRIYKSRGNSFDDFFQGKQIDEKAETARRASNLGTLASGSLQLSQLGLLDKEGTQKARLEVAAAEKAQLENQLNKLEEIGQTSGDFNLLDSIRNIRKSGIVNDAAAARSLKQVPLLAEEGGGDPLSKLAELSGPLGDLSKNIVNLNSNFQTGVQGDFTELSKQAKEAADRLSDLSTAANLLKETAENEKQAKSELDKANLIKDKQTRQNELKEKKVNLSKNELKNLERNTGGSDKTFSDRVDRNFTDRRLGFLGLGSGKGLEKINLGPNPRFGISQFGDPDREYFQSNAASLGVPKAGINEILDSTVEINSSNSSKTTKDLVETVKRLVSGDRDKAISIFEQLVASKPANFNNVGKADSQISGRNIEDLQKGPRQILERLIKTYNYLEKQTSETKSIDDEISTLDREIQELSNKSRGLIPNLSMGSSFLKEKRDIAKGIGGARPGDSPYITHLAGVGPAVVNTGEKIIRNFAGGGKDAVFNRKMMNFAGGLSFPIYDGKEKMNLSDNRAPGIYENGKLISASAPTQKQNSFTRPKNAYERNIGSVLANAELNSQGQRVSIVGSKYGAGYSQFDKGGGFGEYRNSTDYINSEIAKGNPINPENFKPVYADEDSSNSLTANPVNSSGIRPARTIPLKTIAETTKDQNEYFKEQIIQAKLNNSIRTPAKREQLVESGKGISDFAGVTEDTGTSSDFFGNKFKDRSTEFNKNFLKEGDNGYVSLRDKMDDSFSDSGSPFQDSKIQGSGGLGSVSLQGSQRFGGSNKSPDQLEKHYSKTRRGDDTKFDRNTTNTRGGDDRGLGLIESMNKLTAALNAKNKPADGDKPGDIVKPEVAVKHDINVNVVVGGEVNTQDQRVKDIIKQETEQFKQNVENRIKALENKNDGLPPPPPAAVPTS